MKQCVDCVAAEIATNRPIAVDKKTGKPVPGPRCMTHHRAKRKETKAKSHARYIQNTYSLPPGMYPAILAAQGGRCYICQRASGKARMLAVDHDHSCCPSGESCGKCVRALCCGPCNQMLGHLRDDIDAMHRMIVVVRDKPAQAVINSLN